MSWYEMARRAKLCDLFDDDLPIISTKDIERVLIEHSFDITPYRSPERSMEAARCVPMMAIAFHPVTLDRGTIPSLDEFLTEYEESNQKFFDEMGEGETAGVRYRAVKSYPSLVRDVHFVSRARELGATVKRTLRDDFEGTDASIVTPRGERYIRLYYDSPRSRRLRMAKAMVHDISSDHVDLPLTQENAAQVGNIYLYSTEAILELLDEIEALNGGQTI